MNRQAVEQPAYACFFGMLPEFFVKLTARILDETSAPIFHSQQQRGNTRARGEPEEAFRRSAINDKKPRRRLRGVRKSYALRATAGSYLPLVINSRRKIGIRGPLGPSNRGTGGL